MSPQTANENETETPPARPSKRPPPLSLNQQLPPPRPKQNRSMLERGAAQGLKEVYKKFGVEFNEAEDMPVLREARLNRPETPPFPILVFLLAITKDGTDMILLFSDPSGLTGVGLVITALGRFFVTAFTCIAGLTIWLWILGKIRGIRLLGSVRKIWLRRRITTGVLFSSLELFIAILPLTTIYVLMAHHDENKYVKMFDEAAGKLGKALKGKFGK